MIFRKFPFVRQAETMDCGPACLKMVARFYGKDYSLHTLKDKCYIDRQGVSMEGIGDAAEAIGLRTTAALATYDALVEASPFPAIMHWRNNHFIVLYKIDKKERAYIADPSHGLIRLDKEEFIKNWSGTITDGEKEGMLLFFEPAPAFYDQSDAEETTRKKGLKELLWYLRPYRKFIYQLMMGLLAGSLLQMAFPFLAQSIVDTGINTRNIAFINLILIAQVMLFAGRTCGDMIRSWILLHIGSRINISMISDFLAKLTRLPISFFDGKMTGDLMQRVNDHQRVQTFLTSGITSTLFSLLTLVLFTIILGWYNLIIFFIFIGGTTLYAGWITFFLKKRRDVDYKEFEVMANNQGQLIQFLQGMQEIKLNGAEKQKRWKWERLQARLFKISIKGLALDQYQKTGAAFINELKNILITVVAARAVISGDITLGMMLSVQYIIGQLNAPVSELINFARSWQDAHISLERIGEVFSRQDEENNVTETAGELPQEESLHIKNVSFRYGGPQSAPVLNNVSFTIPQGKITAIVGASGSGKTTLLKLLLKFYDPTQGQITIGPHSLDRFMHHSWRSKCGVVMQDGYIFSDTIAKNIAVADENIDRQRLLYAVKVANIQSFIEELPLAYNTKIGNDGIGISGGQRQRILIARAVYKDPGIVMFDEATSSLDAANEKIVMNNLQHFLAGRTAVIIAHRLSTVRNADQIIVLDKGMIAETGSHEELTFKRGTYYSLVKNQLELGN